MTDGRHALVIEDDMIIALEVEDLLHELGYQSCDIAHSPAEALACAQRRKPQLITADVRIIDGTGIDAVRAICVELGHIPVVYITGNIEMLAGEQAPTVVEKPIRPGALAQACAMACRGV